MDTKHSFEEKSSSDSNEQKTLSDNEIPRKENKSNETNSRINKSITITENATNSHPLLYSPIQQFPDLIPEKSRNKVSIDNGASVQEYDIERHLKLQLPQLDEYNETLPGNILQQ